MHGLLIAFLTSMGVGIHAYYHHKREGHKDISARRWMYGLYAAAFLLATVANYGLWLMTILLGGRLTAAYHLFFATLVLLVSYSVVLAGARRRPY